MKKRFLITGAAGHLGNTIIRMLNGKDIDIRGLILENETSTLLDNVQYIKGDVRRIESLRPLFEGCEEYETYVIHAAGIVDISEEVSPALYDVNVCRHQEYFAVMPGISDKTPFVCKFGACNSRKRQQSRTS